ncbi:tryptophan--tRNA ligase [Acidocella aminolytica]|jgi:tryptophanyl-tRNA synthetase|uniref:Tryptophan--tRNA ligase n=1 Tax=Acidocella aminolytica 101 = DSM 11237 TaxID=1120923 RepID=A0A0D6PJ98_9PROT|nr:tryptophan--tRNA ligase [Acidocella aminolytica]GAN81825.1 tryptophanyl-tRNA synthetase [Acidocella aminolytica 101 = DSM 11237]GBQ39157.1 tryptophanyl-tRNA synthetase [Acidocella aminolytica 101 = DSM 11237]SHF57841.1 tryptophanyl-tRNA synthetase [Acidocella aminolytica 101 = DSM 11237]
MARIFSGIQPTGIATLGNYLGALRNWVALQDGEDECIYCLVDLHAITTFQDPVALREQTYTMAALLLACGINPERSVLFHQSAVSAHARLAWIFNCVARMGWLKRMTQFKDKAGKNQEEVSTGLFVYPNLMAADIHAYHATKVPVGDDQLQHIELANDIAEKFNHDFGVSFFPRIEPFVLKETARVMSLRDGTKKMSKSDPSDQSRINMTDDADAIAQKIRKAKTDPEPLPDNLGALAERPEARNLLGIFAAVSGESQEAILARFAGAGFGPFKTALAEALVAHVEPIAMRTREYLADKAELDRILQVGARKAAAIAGPITDEAERIVGFLPR